MTMSYTKLWQKVQWGGPSSYMLMTNYSLFHHTLLFHRVAFTKRRCLSNQLFVARRALPPPPRHHLAPEVHRRSRRIRRVISDHQSEFTGQRAHCWSGPPARKLWILLQDQTAEEDLSQDRITTCSCIHSLSLLFQLIWSFIKDQHGAAVETTTEVIWQVYTPGSLY